jgi:hypothetical protein
LGSRKIQASEAIRSGRRISAGIDDVDADDLENDPNDVGINGKDIL